MERRLQAHHHSLFRQLLGRKADRENSVSAAFAACFRESPVFRDAILQLLWSTCKLRTQRPDVQWSCQTEVVIDAHSRPDVHIQPAPNCTGPLFRLENKVAAPLRVAQLRRYRARQSGEYVVAITKRPPEVGRNWIERNGAFALRWQDVHRAVVRRSGRKHDQYLCESFGRYLEELGMAYREQIRADDLNRVSKLFQRVTGVENTHFDPRDAFRIADDCLGLLDDVMAAAVEDHPKLAKWSRRGASYYKWREEKRGWCHYLAFRFHDANWRTWFGGQFLFQDTAAAPMWEVSGKTPKTGERSYIKGLQSVSTDGKLDQLKMLRSFFAGAKRLGVIT
jgi:hypothetical protein